MLASDFSSMMRSDRKRSPTWSQSPLDGVEFGTLSLQQRQGDVVTDGESAFHFENRRRGTS